MCKQFSKSFSVHLRPRAAGADSTIKHTGQARELKEMKVENQKEFRIKHRQ